MYVYIQRGHVHQSNNPPTVADFLAVEAGKMTVIKIVAGGVFEVKADGLVNIPMSTYSTVTHGLRHLHPDQNAHYEAAVLQHAFA